MIKIDHIQIASDHLIGGRYVPSDSTIDVFSPIDETVTGAVPDGDDAIVDEAIRAAREAFNDWAKAGPAGRHKSLLKFAALIRENADDLALVECVDNGGLLKALRARVIERSAQNIEFFANLALELLGEVIAGGPNVDNVRYEPAGVCALITPWNAPLMLTTWKIGPALAAGNTIVIKPPELAPASCALLGQLAAQAGLPDGVVNIVHGRGAKSGQALIEHPGVDRISFTGSPETGRIIATAAAAHLTPVSLELGGKSPLVVFRNADLDKAAATIAHQYFNAGQVCLAGTRVLADAATAEDLLARTLNHVERLIVGDPRLPDTDIGPLISREQAARVDGFVRRAVEAGAVAVAGGAPSDAGPLYYEPTLIRDVRQDSEIVQNEVFGPVLTWQTFVNEDEAVALANDTKYGLAASLWTNDSDQAHRVGSEIRAGTVWVNSFFVRNLAAPFGGFGESGVGIEGGRWSFDFYCNVKNLSVNK